MLAGGYSEEALGIKVSADVNEAINEITKLNKLLAVTSQGINEFGAAGGKSFGSFHQQVKEGFAGLHQFNEGVNAYTDYTKLSIPIQKEATAGLHQFNEGVNAYADYTNIGKQATYDFQTSQKQGISITKEFNSKMAEGKKQLREIIREEKRFKAEGLNYLFFGMQIQRTFGGIMFSGINAFRSITEATEGTVTNLTVLASSFEFLSFTIGDAINTFLEPFMGVLIDIIDGIADFIQQNPELTALVITFGALAGTLMFIKGTFQVFTDNVKAAKDAIFALNKAWETIKNMFETVKNFVIEVVWKNLIEAYAAFIKWFNTLPKTLQIGITFAILVVVGEFFFELGKKMGEWTYKGFGQGFMEAASESAFGRFMINFFNAWGKTIEAINPFGGHFLDLQLEQFKKEAIAINALGLKGEGQFGIPYVPETGNYLLHAGERVTPANQNSFGNINVTINTTGGINGEQVARDIMKELANYTTASTIR